MFPKKSASVTGLLTCAPEGWRSIYELKCLTGRALLSEIRVAGKEEYLNILTIIGKER